MDELAPRGRPSPRVGPVYGYPRAYGYAPPVAYVPAPAPVTIRGSCR